MGVATLLVTTWATDPHGLAFARTMGFTTFAFAHVFFAVATKDERRSLFNRDTFADKPLLIALGAALAVIVLQTSLSPLQRLLQTTDLELEHWLICIGAALVIPIVSELRKLLVHRNLDEVPTESTDGDDTAVSPTIDLTAAA